jgi:hypothetical protein
MSDEGLGLITASPAILQNFIEHAILNAFDLGGFSASVSTVAYCLAACAMQDGQVRVYPKCPLTALILSIPRQICGLLQFSPHR